MAETVMVSAILPTCPFCAAHRLDVREAPTTLGLRYHVACLGCGARGPVGDSPNRANAGWARRRAGETLLDALEMLTTAMRNGETDRDSLAAAVDLAERALAEVRG